MTSTQAAPFLALAASLCFAGASLVYRKFSSEVSALWMNAFKALVSSSAFAVSLCLDPALISRPATIVIAILALSGFIGLNVGDYFLLKSYAAIGAGRTLMIFSFNPLFIGVASYFLFDQSLEPRLFGAVACLSVCVLILGHESYTRERRWNLGGLAGALAAALMDASGVLMTRWAFNLQPTLSVFEGNLIRCLGALVGFVLMSRWLRIDFVKRFRALSPRNRALALGASLMGTFCALALWLAALKQGHLASVAAIGGSGPVFATLLEAVLLRRWPGWHLYASLIAFAVGFRLLL